MVPVGLEVLQGGRRMGQNGWGVPKSGLVVASCVPLWT